MESYIICTCVQSVFHPFIHCPRVSLAQLNHTGCRRSLIKAHLSYQSLEISHRFHIYLLFSPQLLCLIECSLGGIPESHIPALLGDIVSNTPLPLMTWALLRSILRPFLRTTLSYYGLARVHYYHRAFSQVRPFLYSHLSTWLFVQWLISANMKEDTRGPNYWIFMRGRTMCEFPSWQACNSERISTSWHHHDNAINFLWNAHNRFSIPHWWCWAMGCLSWIQNLM